MATLNITAPLTIAAGAVWPPVCAGVVLLRFIIRRSQDNRYGLDDWLVLPALLLVTGMGAGLISGAALKALGYPTPPPPPGVDPSAYYSREQHIVRILFFSTQLMAIVALGCIKVSVLFFYKRIFGNSGRRLIEFSIYALIIINTIWALGYFFATLFLCGSHVEYVVTSIAALSHPECVNTVAEQLSYAITDFLLDIIILVFPIPLVWNLRMPSKKKLAVTGVFLVGALAIVASTIRLVIAVQTLNVEFAAGIDPDKLSTNASYFQLIEVGFALCAVCLPSLSGGVKLEQLRHLMQNFGSVTSVFSKSSVKSKEMSNEHGSTRPLSKQGQSLRRKPSRNNTLNTRKNANTDVELEEYS